MRPAFALALVVLAALLGGCGLDGGSGAAGSGGTPTVRQRPDLRQEANGPLLGDHKPQPLTVKLGTPAKVHPHFKVNPRAGLLFDMKTGEVLWARNPTRVLPMASVTKMMTALIASERLPAGTKVKITKQAVDYQRGGSAVGVLPRGKRIGIQTMLYGLMLPSGNDAAIAISQRVSGTMKAFVETMNAKARSMDLQCTHYTRPDGFQDAGNHTCAYDLAALAKAVLDDPRLANIVRHFSVELPFPIKGGKLFLYNHNPLLRLKYPGTLGIKTGFTDAAGHCLVAAVQRGNRRLGVVLLHSPNIYDQATALFGAGFKRN